MALINGPVRWLLLILISLYGSVVVGQNSVPQLVVLDYVYLKNHSRFIGQAVYMNNDSMLELTLTNGNIMTIPGSSIRKIKQRLVGFSGETRGYRMKPESKYSHLLSLSVITPAYETEEGSGTWWFYSNPYSNGGLQIDYKLAYQLRHDIQVGATVILQKGYLMDHLFPNTGVGIGAQWLPLQGRWTPYVSWYNGYLKVWNFQENEFQFRSLGGIYASPTIGLSFQRRNGRSWHFGSGLMWQQMIGKYGNSEFELRSKYTLKRWVFELGIEL